MKSSADRLIATDGTVSTSMSAENYRILFLALVLFYKLIFLFCLVCLCFLCLVVVTWAMLLICMTIIHHANSNFNRSLTQLMNGLKPTYDKSIIFTYLERSWKRNLVKIWCLVLIKNSSFIFLTCQTTKALCTVCLAR